MNAQQAEVEPIRVRIMQEAYDLADRNDSEGYNSVKVACSDVLAIVEELIAATRAAEQDRCCRIIYGMAGSDNVAQRTVDAIRGKE